MTQKIIILIIILLIYGLLEYWYKIQQNKNEIETNNQEASSNQQNLGPEGFLENKSSANSDAELNLKSTESEMNKTESEMNKTESEMNKTESEMNKTESEMNKTESETNKTESETNKTESEMNKTESNIEDNKDKYQIEYIYSKRKLFQEEAKKIRDQGKDEEFSWFFKNNIKNKLSQFSNEDKKKLQAIQLDFKNLYIKYDHDINTALKYDKIKID